MRGLLARLNVGHVAHDMLHMLAYAQPGGARGDDNVLDDFETGSPQAPKSKCQTLKV